MLQGYPGVDHSLKVGRKVFDLLERTPAIESLPDPVTEIDLKEGIRFDRVKFRYPTAHQTAASTFTGVSFLIKSGTSTAIVGPSGSGKSTIV